MKKNLLLLLASLLLAMCASAQVTVCGVYLEDGQVSSPYIKSGTVTWNATSRTPRWTMPLLITVATIPRMASDPFV